MGEQARELHDQFNELTEQRPRFGTPGFEEHQAKLSKTYKNEERIRKNLFAESSEGMPSKKAEKIVEALAIYEQLVAEECGIPAVYDHARVLYSKAKRYGDAMRICESFITVANKVGKDCN